MDRLLYLLQQYAENSSSEEELQELKVLINVPANEQIASRLLEQILKQTEPLPTYSETRLQAVLLQIKSAAPVKQINRKWYRYAAAASIILLISITLVTIFTNQHKPTQSIAKNNNQFDIAAPVNNKATITLANGQKVFLDSLSNGTLAQQGNVKLVKFADGRVAYQTASGEMVKQLQYNTLFNPRGSKVANITLADGSRVWLNAGSSITYPIAFVTEERRVSITGEAYFEVTHDAAKPFSVSRSDMSVQVLGTHFNVNAYEDESAIKVTLLEGSVNVSRKSSIVKIKPGEQATLQQEQGDNEIKVEKSVDLEQVMAWKNGEFQFGNKTDIKTIMRQLSRWYNIEVEYKGDINGHIGGSISRDANISQVLKMLEKTGSVKFEIEGTKVTVMP